MKPETTSTQLPPTLLMILSTTAGLAVASLYYCQPLMALLGQAFATNGSTLGTLPTLTQAGYALGLLLLIPLGDKFDRRQLILLKSLALTIALGLMAVRALTCYCSPV